MRSHIFLVLGVLFLSAEECAAQTFLADWPTPDNGQVSAIAYDTTTHTVFLGGSFTAFGGQPRNRLAAIDVVSGQLTDWAPGANGPINAMWASGGQLFVGGAATQIGGPGHGNLARFDIATGAIVNGWFDGTFSEIVTDLYVANDLLHVQTPVNGGRALTLTSPAAVMGAYGPSIDGGPLHVLYAIAATDDVRFAGGRFDQAVGTPAIDFAAMDLSTGEVLPWNHSFYGEGVQDIIVSNGLVYVAGMYYAVNGQSRFGLVAMDATSGELTAFNPGLDDGLYSISLRDDILYMGGVFNTLSGQPRHALAALDLSTGLATSWDPQLNFSGGVTDVHVAGDMIFASGSFTSVQGVPHSGFAAWALSPVGIAENEPMQWSVYPNPTAGMLQVRSTVKARTIEIYNVLGTRVGSLPFTSTLDISQFANGVYSLVLTGAKGEVLGRQRVVLEK